MPGVSESICKMGSREWPQRWFYCVLPAVLFISLANLQSAQATFFDSEPTAREKLKQLATSTKPVSGQRVSKTFRHVERQYLEETYKPAHQFEQAILSVLQVKDTSFKELMTVLKSDLDAEGYRLLQLHICLSFEILAPSSKERKKARKQKQASLIKDFVAKSKEMVKPYWKALLRYRSKLAPNLPDGSIKPGPTPDLPFPLLTANRQLSEPVAPSTLQRLFQQRHKQVTQAIGYWGAFLSQVQAPPAQDKSGNKSVLNSFGQHLNQRLKKREKTHIESLRQQAPSDRSLFRRLKRKYSCQWNTPLLAL